MANLEALVANMLTRSDRRAAGRATRQHGGSATTATRPDDRTAAPRPSPARASNALLENMRRWNDDMAAIGRSTDAVEMSRHLMHGLRRLVQPDAVYVGFLRRAAPPIALMHDSFHERDRQYVEGAYLLDPNYQLFLQSNPTTCIPLRDIAADEFKRGDYYRTYYQYSGIMDEVAFLVRVEEDVAGHICAMRLTGSSPFKRSEIDRLRSVQPLAALAAERIWSCLGDDETAETAEDRALHRLLAREFEQFGADVLSGRKLEIMRLLLKGHGAKVIGRALAISPGTVRNHMKQIYASLGVSSQAALFASFFDRLMSSTLDEQ